MIKLRVFMADCDRPSPASEGALRHAQAAADRFPGLVAVEVVALDAPAARELGIAMEPTVLVSDFVVAVGQAPPAGHLVRALEAALAREKSDPHGCDHRGAN